MRIHNRHNKQDLADFFLWADSATPFLRWHSTVFYRWVVRAFVILGWLLLPLDFWYSDLTTHLELDAGEKKSIRIETHELFFLPALPWLFALLLHFNLSRGEHQERVARRNARRWAKKNPGDLDQTLELRDDGIAILRPPGYETVIDYDRFLEVIHRKRITILQPKEGIRGSVLVSHEGKSPEEVNRFIDAFRKRCNGLKGAGPVSEGNRR
jgi:hypothetical protein